MSYEEEDACIRTVSTCPFKHARLSGGGYMHVICGRGYMHYKHARWRGESYR